MKRVLVTGGAGFIGVGLVARLLEEGHTVVVLDNLFRGKQDHLKPLVDRGAVFVEGDVTRSEDLDRCYDALGGVDLIHHLAAINGTKWFHEAAMKVIDVNINGTLCVLNKAKQWRRSSDSSCVDLGQWVSFAPLCLMEQHRLNLRW